MDDAISSILQRHEMNRRVMDAALAEIHTDKQNVLDAAIGDIVRVCTDEVKHLRTELEGHASCLKALQRNIKAQESTISQLQEKIAQQGAMLANQRKTDVASQEQLDTLGARLQAIEESTTHDQPQSEQLDNSTSLARGSTLPEKLLLQERSSPHTASISQASAGIHVMPMDAGKHSKAFGTKHGKAALNKILMPPPLPPLSLASKASSIVPSKTITCKIGRPPSPSVPLKTTTKMRRLSSKPKLGQLVNRNSDSATQPLRSTDRNITRKKSSIKSTSVQSSGRERERFNGVHFAEDSVIIIDSSSPKATSATSINTAEGAVRDCPSSPASATVIGESLAMTAAVRPIENALDPIPSPLINSLVAHSRHLVSLTSTSQTISDHAVPVVNLKEEAPIVKVETVPSDDELSVVDVDRRFQVVKHINKERIPPRWKLNGNFEEQDKEKKTTSHAKVLRSIALGVEQG